MDALSAVLKTLRLSSMLYCRSELTAPWGLRSDRRDVATFHAVRHGSCWMQSPRLRHPVRLSAGDLVRLNEVWGPYCCEGVTNSTSD
jgi:hypothetical protein